MNAIKQRNQFEKSYWKTDAATVIGQMICIFVLVIYVS